MVDHVILALRMAPDWAGFARDHAAGIAIDPARYIPTHNPRFPGNVPAMIQRWDRLSAVPFFACRERLRAIAAGTLARVRGVTFTQWSGVPDLLAGLNGAPFLLFYHDDDDWFDPQMADALRGLDTETFDAVLFPMPVLAKHVRTFTRGGRPSAVAVGHCVQFEHRYHTNNYGLTRRAVAAGGLEQLMEHTGASETARALRFTDLYIDRIISATSKTPCSASRLGHNPGHKDAFRTYVQAYIGELQAITLPPGSEWIAQPLRETIELFQMALG
jgi:hypothetical protein